MLSSEDFILPSWQVVTVILCLTTNEFVDGQIRYSIPEEMVTGSFVGNIAEDLGLSLKRLVTGRARVLNRGSNQYVGLNLEKGILVVNERIDREQLCRLVSPCSFNFELIIENPIELHRVAVEVLDINDNAPVFEVKDIKLEIVESSHLGTRFSLQSAVDPDVGVNSLQSYALNPTNHFNLKLHSQTDGSKYVEMVLQRPLDREKESELTLILTASDGGNPRKSGTLKIHIFVLDANDNAPVFSQTMYKASVFEDALMGTIVTTVTATDADQGSNGHIAYCFPQVTSAAFEIDEKTGEIRVSGPIDFEKTTFYDINIQAKDEGGLTDSSKVLIDVIDVNDNKPVINVMSFSSIVPEDAPVGTTVAVINVEDADSGKNSQFQCTINNDVPFKITSSLTNYYTLLTDSTLDREETSAYSITITASDEGSPRLSSNQTFTMNISDVNDNVPIFSKSEYTANVMENNAPGLSIMSVTARDSDWNQNARISYLLQDKPTDAASYISMNSETGVIHAVRSFDFEQLKSFRFEIMARDGGSPPLNNSVTVTVNIQDQNDNAPQILYPVQTGVSLTTEMVPRSADVGYLVTKVVAVDMDSGQNSWLTYKMLTATDRSLFEVDLQNGEVRTLRRVTDKDAAKQRFTVVVEDNGRPSRSASVTVNLVVADSFPEVLSEFTDFTQDKDYNDNLTFYLVLALAVVSFLFISSLVVIISVKVYRWRQSRIFYQSNLPIIPYYPPRYADAGGTGTLQHVYNYEVCRTTDSRKSDCTFMRPCESVLMLDPSSTETMQHVQKEEHLMGDSDSSTEVRLQRFILPPCFYLFWESFYYFF